MMTPEEQQLQIELRKFAIECAITIGKQCGLSFNQEGSYNPIEKAEEIYKWLIKE